MDASFGLPGAGDMSGVYLLRYPGPTPRENRFSLVVAIIAVTIVAMTLLDLAPGEQSTVMAIVDDAAGESRNKKSRKYE